MKVIIVGGVATGPKVAARLRRISPEAEITVIEQGDLVSYGACGLPLYMAGLVPQMEELMMTSSGTVRNQAYFAEQKGIQVLNNTRVIAINRSEKKVMVQAAASTQVEWLAYDYLVLATGAVPIIPPIPGHNLDNVFTIHHPHSAEKLREMIRKKRIGHLTVIGAGLIGLEIVDALQSPRLQITVCERESQPLPKLLEPELADILGQEMRRRRSDLRLGCNVTAFIGDEAGLVRRVVTDQGEILTQAVVIAAGVRPEVALARGAGLEIGVTGAIMVNSHLQTSDPNIYAGGDCVEQNNRLTGNACYVPLASTANKHGRIIANNIAGLRDEFPGIMKTSVLQVFGLNVGRTGLGEDEAKQQGYRVVTSLVCGYDSAHFHPMHERLTLKLIAEEPSGRLLGAQVIGSGEGIKRLDVLATALSFKATLQDISHLDLGYAPAFSTAVDVVIHAANALENKRKGLVESLSPCAFLKSIERQDPICLLDVRNQDEIENNPLGYANVLSIPLGELRQRYPEVPVNCKIITICELGVRGYEAACFLKGLGLNQVAYLEGGTSCLPTLGKPQCEYTYFHN